jgi:hypothetical protein
VLLLCVLYAAQQQPLQLSAAAELCSVAAAGLPQLPPLRLQELVELLYDVAVPLHLGLYSCWITQYACGKQIPA